MVRTWMLSGGFVVLGVLAAGCDTAKNAATKVEEKAKQEASQAEDLAKRAKDDVKAELIIDRIATKETIDVTDEEVTHELEHMASHSGESADAIRARLTKQGALDRMKAKLRSDKTLDWLAQNAQVKTVAAASAATDSK